MSNTKLTPKARLMVIMERMRETYNEEAWGINQRMMIPTSGIKSRILSMGDVDVLLEQSTDMITWTQCLPGTYNVSTQKRFFRVRAVEK